MRTPIQMLSAHIIGLIVAIGAWTGAGAQSLVYPNVEQPVFARDFHERCIVYIEESLIATVEAQPMPEDRRVRREIEQRIRNQRQLLRLVIDAPHEVFMRATDVRKADIPSKVVSTLALRMHRGEPLSYKDLVTRAEAEDLASLGPAAHFLALLASQMQQPGERPIVDLLERAGVESLKARPLRGEEIRLITTFGEEIAMLGAPVINRLFDAWEKAGGFDRWAREYLLGMNGVQVGWQGRSRTGDAVMRDLFAEATPHLLRAHELAPHRPEAASALILIAGVLNEPVGGKSAQEWFDLAARATFDWPEAFQNAETVVRDSRDGRDQSMLEFGLSCARTQQYATIVPWQLVRFLNAVEARRGDGRVYQYPGLWEIVKPMSRIAQRSPRNMPNPKGFFRLVAEIAIGAEAWDDAVDAIRQWSVHADRAYDPKTDGEDPRDPKFAPRLFPNLIGDPRSLEEAETLARAGRLGEAIAVYRRLLDAKPANVYARAFLRGRIMDLERPAQYRAGEWIDIGPELGVPGWSLSGYFLHTEDNGWIQPIAPESDQRTGVFALNVAPALPYEVEGEFRVSSRAAVGTTLRFWIAQKFAGQGVMFVQVPVSGIKPPNLVLVTTRFQQPSERMKIGKGEHRFRLLVTSDRVEFTIDGQTAVWDNLGLGGSFEPLFRMQGGTSDDADDIAFRNLRIRQLPK